MAEVKISVIISSFNQKKFLSEAIESVLSQTLRPFEIIIVDDASEDSSDELINEYCRKFPHLIRYFLQGKHLGVAANKSYGLRQVRGDLVTILDGDDRFLPLKLEMEYDTYIKSQGANIVYSNHYIINEEGERKKLWCPLNKRMPTGNVFGAVFTLSFPYASYHYELIEINCFKQIGFIDTKFTIWEDWDWRLRMAKEFRVAYCPVPLAEYRQHSSQSHRKKRSLHYLMLRKIYEKNSSLLNSLPIFWRLVIKAATLSYINAHEVFLLGKEKKLREKATKRLLQLIRRYYLFYLFKK